MNLKDRIPRPDKDEFGFTEQDVEVAIAETRTDILGWQSALADPSDLMHKKAEGALATR